MKKIKILLAIMFVGSLTVKAQIQADPAHWAYGLKKLSGNTYEVHLLCTIDMPWHIYAQKQTEDFIGTATKFTFEKQSGLTLIGKPLEHGKKDTFINKEVQIKNYEYGGKVDFVQKVTISPNVKMIRGKVDYQTCTHERCLTATNVQFEIPVSR